MIETALIFDQTGHTLAWHEPEGRSGGSLPDSLDLWEFLWANRERIGGVAHTHPWDGPAGPSGTDVTTFRACELALGKLLLWPVVTFTDVTYCVFNSVTGKYVPGTIEGDFEIEGLEELRERSKAPIVISPLVAEVQPVQGIIVMKLPRSSIKEDINQGRYLTFGDKTYRVVRVVNKDGNLAMQVDYVPTASELEQWAEDAKQGSDSSPVE